MQVLKWRWLRPISARLLEPMMEPDAREAVDGMLEMAEPEQSDRRGRRRRFIICSRGLAEEWSAQLAAGGSFIACAYNDSIRNGIFYRDAEGPRRRPVALSWGSAATKAQPAVTDPEAEWPAFLGAWTLTDRTVDRALVVVESARL